MQVAALAGVPAPVIRDARRKLSELEIQAAASQGPDLFMMPAEPAPDVASAPHPLVEAFAELDPEMLSPREALDWLFRMKKHF